MRHDAALSAQPIRIGRYSTYVRSIEIHLPISGNQGNAIMFFWAALLLIIAPIAALWGWTDNAGTAAGLDGLAFVFGFALMWLLLLIAASTLHGGPRQH